MTISEAVKFELLRKMLLSRIFEEKIVSVYAAQDMKTPVHLCIGQEAVAAGVCQTLEKKDYVFSTHRNHGHLLCKGAAMMPMFAELYGREGGCSGGKGGSMHLLDDSCGCMGTSAIVGGSVPLAAGAALAAKMHRDGRISAAFFGDGASEEGSTYETLSFAALKKLPVLFICENNFYATSSHLSARQPMLQMCEKAAPFMPSIRVDGNNVEAVYDAAMTAAARARNGSGPSFIECVTYRWKGHVGPECDYEKGCRPKEELDKWLERCPVKNYRARLLSEGVVTEDMIEHLEARIANDVNEAWSKARELPYPDGKNLTAGVYR